ncbi:MAG: hypothetical protein PVJ32_04745 [Anaerolineales bacterium]|jgi:hypothetical protein
MSSGEKSAPSAELQKILESAKRLGVEMDEAEALQWLTAVSASTDDEDVVHDTRTGVFGHKVTMLDFSPEQLAHFRKLGRLVEFLDQPGVVETALALSGSSAQSKIQSYPGDADYFERVNIIADTREQACKILADLIREKALETAQGPTYQLIEVKFGSYPEDMVREGDTMKAGAPISWTLGEVEAGKIQGSRPDGSPLDVSWEQASVDPGWCKLDWVVADPVNKTLANASNMLDVTWEGPEGKIVPLDGYLDPYFQEVYLEAESIPLFSKLSQHVSADALEDYVGQLEKEIQKYVTKDINYGKAAKRMYNVFRLTGRYGEAAFVRELFDEPATMLYQVWSLVRTIDDTMTEEHSLPITTILAQADRLILSVVEVLEGEQETEIVRQLLRLKDAMVREAEEDGWDTYVETARLELINLVNNFFYDRLISLPTIKQYIEDFQA